MTDGLKTNAELLSDFEGNILFDDGGDPGRTTEQLRAAVLARMVEPVTVSHDAEKLAFSAIVDMGEGRTEAKVVELTVAQVIAAAKHIPVERWPNVPQKHTKLEDEAREIAKLAAALYNGNLASGLPPIAFSKTVAGALQLLAEARKQVTESAA